MDQVDVQSVEPVAEPAPEPEKTFTQAEIDAMKAEWDRQLQETQATLQQQTIKHAFYRKATEQGIAEADKLLQFIDLSAVTFDESGQPQGIDEIIGALTSAVAAVPKREPKTIGGPTGYSTGDKTPQMLLQEAAERARQSGRLEHRAFYSSLKQKLGGK